MAVIQGQRFPSERTLNNQDSVEVSDRQTVGPKPDDSGSAGGASPAGGATPSGSAGGDLTGSYPSPTLAAIVAAAGPIGDATHVAAVTIDAKGRVTVLASVPITFPTSLPPNGAAGGVLAGTYPNPALASGATVTAVLAKITPGGANGSLTVAGGVVTAYSAPT